MLRFVLYVIVLGTLAGSAWTADDGGGQKPAVAPLPVGPNQGGIAGNWSYAKNDRIMKALGLTDEQAAKIDELFKDMQAAQRELYKGKNANGGPQSSAISRDDMTGLQEKAKALRAAFDTKVSDLLTAEQKVKNDAAQKIMSDSQKAMQELFAKSGNANNNAMTPEDRKTLQESMAKINRDREEALAKVLGQAPPKEGSK